MRARTFVRLVLGAALLLVWAPTATTAPAGADTVRALKLFGDVFERVKQDYVEDIDDEKLVEYAIQGMLSSLDPHSGYLNAERYREMQIQTRGEFGGLGIEVTMENGLVKVVAPIDDTPAARAGIRAGDLISHIDGEPVMGLTLNEAVQKMRGPVGTKIKLRILRKGVEKPIDVEITRAVIRISPVRARLEGDVAYVRITTFNERAASELEQAVARLRRESGDELVGLVLDLRNNPGGLLEQAIAVADAFLEGGEIVSTRGRRPDSMQRFNARPGDITDGLPMVVLINGGSASASEIVAGALQDHGRAVVMGTRSFGKGSVQTIIPIPGHGALRLTTARYYTPSGRSIQALGIEPDIVVHQAEVKPLLEQETGRREADLRNRLDNDTAVDPDTGKPREEEEPLDVRDYQLARAVDLLRGLALLQAREGG